MNKFMVRLLLMLALQSACSSDQQEYGDDYEDRHDVTVNQMLVPRTHQADATRILNSLLEEYDRTLRPDIGDCFIPVVP